MTTPTELSRRRLNYKVVSKLICDLKSETAQWPSAIVFLNLEQQLTIPLSQRRHIINFVSVQILYVSLIYGLHHSDSAVSIAARYGLDGPETECR